MNKTKHLKKYRLIKKTKKYFGGNKDEPLNSEKIDDKNNNEKEGTEKEGTEKEGVIDIVEDKVTDFAEDTGNFLKDKTLRLFGLQPINENESNEDSQQIDKSINKLSDSTSGLVSNVQSIGNDVANVFNKGSAAIIGNINDVLDSPKVENSVTDAAKETVQIGTKLLEKFNNNLNNPRFKEETKEYLDNIADYAEISVKALNEPLDNAIDELNQAGTKALAGVVSGSVKVGTDALGAIPGVGAIIDVGKMINDSTKAASTVVEAGSEAAETASNLFLQTNEGIKKGLQELKEKKDEAINISKRTSDSINQFKNPSLALFNEVGKVATKEVGKVGGRKTKKRLLKRKTKSKRVRFSF